jgi:hypothetical protein
MKAAGKSLINDIRDDENGTTVWDDIETFTDKVPETPEAAREVVEALVHMFYT